MDQDTNILEGQIDIQTTKQNDPPSDKVIISHLHATKIFFKLTENSTFGQKTEFNKQTNQPTKQPTIFSMVKHAGNKVGDMQLLNFNLSIDIRNINKLLD